MKPLSLPRLFLAGLGAMMATLGAMVALPHDPYIRWQSTQTEAYARLGWAYERIHYDPTPIDVAFIGTSHTMNGINGPLIHQTLAAGGRCLKVTNLAIPQYGRNLQWAIARELFAVRRPRLLVLEVMENESRKAHPLFYRVATTQDMLSAPAIGNQNYLADLVRLPWRQTVLAAQSLAPAEFGLKSRWSAAHYDGSDVDNTSVINVNRQALTPPRTRALPEADLKSQAVAKMAEKNLHMLPARFAAQEYALPHHYVSAILAMADRAGTPVLLLYLPGYGRPAQPYDMRLYAGRQMLRVNEPLAKTDNWYDVDHLNAGGAAQVSRQVAALIGPQFSPTSATPCTNGLAPTGVLKPFQRQVMPGA